jgi:UBA/TS-N domain
MNEADPLRQPPDRPRRGEHRADRRRPPLEPRRVPHRNGNANAESPLEWFRGAPISKGLLIVSMILYLIVHQYHTPSARELWSFNSLILSKRPSQGFRFFTSKVLFASNTEVIVGTTLQLFLYRKFEREFGSYQFLKLVLTIYCLTIAQEMVIFQWLSRQARYWSYGGPYCVLGALFLYYHWYIPRLHPRFVSLFNFHFSEKSLYYFWFLYLLLGSNRDATSRSDASTLSGWQGALIPVVMGMVSACMYHVTSQNRFVLQLDRRIHATIVEPLLQRFVSEGNHTTAVMRGIAQQIIAPAIAANAAPQPGLRQRHAPTVTPAAPAAANNHNGSWMQEIPLPEPDLAAVEQLTAMGFPQPQVMEALRQSHNNVEHAANRLLSGE